VGHAPHVPRFRRRFRQRRPLQHLLSPRAAGGAPPYALRVEVNGKVLTYSGDTEWVEDLIPAGQGADLFICEAYFFDKKMKYHIDYSTLMKHLPEIGAKRTIVTHMSAELLARAAEIACEAAHDGLAVEF
jgi:ribonuclease BN (tRNA processing enzyme)